MKSLVIKATMAAFAVATFAAPALAQNIIINGDFEEASLAPEWAVAPGNEIVVATGATYVPCCSGSVSSAALGLTNRFAAFGGGNVANVSTLSQVLNTVAGTIYTVSYKLTALGGGTQDFRASALNGITSLGTLLSTATAGQPFQTYTFNFTAATNSTTLAFAVAPPGIGSGDGIDVILDDVTVSAAPEPGTWAMMILGFGVAGTALRTRRRRLVAA